MHSSFNAFTAKTATKFRDLEKLRVTLRRNGLLKGLAVALAIMILATVVYLLINRLTAAMFLFVFAVVLFLLFVGVNSRELTEQYKKTIIADMVAYLCEGAKFFRNKGIPQETFDQSELFNHIDRYSSWDLIEGKTQNTPFSVAEITAEKRAETGYTHSVTWNTVFRGNLFVIDLGDAQFNGHTVIQRDNWLDRESTRQPVLINNEAFSRQYEVFSNDPDEAKKILSPQFITLLLNLDKKYCRQITLSFYKSNVILALPTPTHGVEASIWHPVVKSNIMRRQFNLLHSLLKIASYLDQHKKEYTRTA